MVRAPRGFAADKVDDLEVEILQRSLSDRFRMTKERLWLKVAIRKYALRS
jgi:hypothetical protein